MLNEDQIEQLFAFCRKHYIHFYEVQTELVDHLANDIEGRMAADTKLNFEAALERSYQAFGGWRGMQRIQEEKKRMIARAHRKLKWQLFLSYFKLPKLAFTLFLVAACYVIVTALPFNIARIIMVGSILSVIIWELRNVWKVQRKMTPFHSKLLLFQNAGGFSFHILMFLCMNQLLVHLTGTFWQDAGSVTIPDLRQFCIFFPLYVIMTNSYRSFLQKVYAEARQSYPAVFEVAGG